jgi:DNA ligase-1
MPVTWKPLLAYNDKIDLRALRYPLYVSPKYDGIRGLIDPNQNLLSRKLKKIPNKHARAKFEDARLIGMEGELIAGPPTAPDVMQRTTSAVMSEDTKDPELRLYVFDLFTRGERPYKQALEYMLYSALPKDVVVVEQNWVKDAEHALQLEEVYVSRGFEGIILRDPYAPYKQGRSTLKEQYLLKFKRFEDSEAEILEVEEMMHNNNEMTTDERGYAKRSKAKGGMTPAGMFGRAKVRDIHTGVEFYLGSGPYLTLEMRIFLWKPAARRALPGAIWKYRFQNVGVKEKPRFPRVLGPRDMRDL